MRQVLKRKVFKRKIKINVKIFVFIKRVKVLIKLKVISKLY